MKTFMSWLIANIGGSIDVCLIIGYEILLFGGYLPFQESDFISMAIYGALFIPLFHGLLVGGYPSKGIAGDIYNIGVLAVEYIIAFVLKDNPEYAFLSIYAWGIVPALGLAIGVAVFTANNMHEVVSRRMLYVHSNANMFEMKLMYTFNRFVAAFGAFSFVFLLISLLKKFTI